MKCPFLRNSSLVNLGIIGFIGPTWRRVPWMSGDFYFWLELNKNYIFWNQQSSIYYLNCFTFLFCSILISPGTFQGKVDRWVLEWFENCTDRADDSLRPCHSPGTINYCHNGIYIYIYICYLHIRKVLLSICSPVSWEKLQSLSLLQKIVKWTEFKWQVQNGALLVGFGFSLGLFGMEPRSWTQSLFP